MQKGKRLRALMLSMAVMSTAVFPTGDLSGIGPAPVEAKAANAARQVEALDRGVTAISVRGGIYVNWRFLGTDPANAVFNLYRDGVPVNTEPISGSTNYLDTAGSLASSYQVEMVVNGNAVEKSSAVTPYGGNYFDIPISIPAGGKTPSGQSYTYTANDASCADLDGDGQYEIVLKWLPTNAGDNMADGYRGNVYYDAYEMDGTQLWRINMGVNIRAGQHYTPFLVYDFDGDGYAEMVCKTADGTVDGAGNVIGTAGKDWRNGAGTIMDGPEYLTLFDGLTGAALDTINYEPSRGANGKVDKNYWGDDFGNRSERYLATVAYLNGVTPSVVMCRGYYKNYGIAAYDIVNKKFSKRWFFDTAASGNSAYIAQGNHNLATADCDGDGFDEIVYGGCTIDHNGRGLYSSGLGHGDALHVGDFLPDTPGLEIWTCCETSPYGACLRKASNGQVIFRWTAGGDTGRAIAGNFIDGNATAEFAASCSGDLVDGAGKKVANWSDITKWGQNFTIYWDGDLAQEALDRTMIDGYGKGRMLTAPGVSYINSTKSNCSLCADLFGDWREEIIWPIYDNTALRVFMTTDMTSYRIPTFMHDTQYRCQIATQNVGYNQPAHTSFFLDSTRPLPGQPNVYAVKAPSMEGTYFIKNAYSNLYLDVANGLADDGTNIQQHKFNGSYAQKFKIVKDAEGYYSIMTGASDYTSCVDVSNGSGADGTNIIQYTYWGGAPQKYRIKKNADGSVAFLTKASNFRSALDVYNWSKANGGNVDEWSYWGGTLQHWYLEPILDGTYYIQNAYSGLYMDVDNGLTENGTNVRQHKYNGSDAQKFRLEYRGDGYYTIYTGATQYTSCLDIPGDQDGDGANVWQWQYYGNSRQGFKFVANADGSYSILTQASGDTEAVEVYGWSKTNAANISQWSFLDGKNQHWKLVKAE
ncbi:MAG: hypothetical protein E7294_00260 [Lachnospiraceae bacterium]|nr:hypothetical protein [Lachnospiraceae bacterium]